MLARLWGAANGGHDSCEAASSTEGANHEIMSVSEREQTKFVHRERRMWIMIAAKAASSTEGANHDILNLSFAMQVQMKMLACGNHDNFTRKYNSY